MGIPGLPKGTVEALASVPQFAEKLTTISDSLEELLKIERARAAREDIEY